VTRCARAPYCCAGRRTAGRACDVCVRVCLYVCVWVNVCVCVRVHVHVQIQKCVAVRRGGSELQDVAQQEEPVMCVYVYVCV